MERSRFFLRGVLFALLAVFLTTAANAQYRASVQGVIADSQGALVSGAKVTVTAQETGLRQETTTDDNGVFAIGRLAPGLYKIEVEKNGFRKKVLENVSISAEQSNGVSVTLDVGAVSESVTVNGSELPAIDTETGNISGTLTSREIQSLPIFGRDPYQAARLAPGIFGDGATNGNGSGRGLPGSNQSSSGSTGSIFMTENQPQIVAGGTRNNGNSYQIDGVEVNSLAWGGSAVITPNEESVKEVQIQANPYSAENGRNSGAQVLVVTKNGTNDFHGSAFLKIHRPGLDAYQRWSGPFPSSTAPFGHLRDSNRFNQMGGSIGGPILKNRLFFFYSMEQLRNVINGPGPSGWYETPQFDSLVGAKNTNSISSKFLTYPGNTIQFTQVNPVKCTDVGLTEGTNCATISQGGNIVGLDVGSPLTSALGTHDSTFGKANTPSGVGNGLDGVPDIFNVNVLQSDRNISTQYNGRLDFQASSKDLIAFSTFWVPSNNDGFFNGAPRKYNLWNSDRINYAPTLLWDHTFSPSLLNEARFNVTRWWFNEATSNPQIPFGFPTLSMQTIGLGVWAGGTCPFCGFFGPAGPGIFYQTTYNVRDTLTKIHKSHSLKFGTDIYKEQDNDETPWNGIPSYNFNNLWDFANDAPTLEGGDFNPVTGVPQSSIKHIRSNIYAFFVQDDYKLKPNLTLNLGLRWEYFGPLHEKDGLTSTALLGSGVNTLTGLHMQVGGNLYNTSYHNFGPQIGLAWSPKSAFGHNFNNKLVLRGGFGIAYNRMQEAVTLNGRFNYPLDVQFSVWGGSLTGSNIFYAVANNAKDFTSYPSNPHAIEAPNPTTNLPACAPATCAAPSITAFDHNLPTPTVYRYSAETQYDLGSRWVATVGYQGSLSKNFTRQINNLNWLYPNNTNPAVSGVDFYTNDADGHYNALLTRLQHQFTKTYQFDVQYMYSLCMDHGSSDYFAYQPYPFSPGPSWGHCDYDATNSFKAFGVWAPRIFRGANDWRERIAGGWEFSGIFSYHTGFPFSPYFGGPTVTGQVVPASYTGGAGSGGNSTFEKAFGNFSQLASVTCPCSSIPYFGIPALNSLGIPPVPGIERNLFRGPGFHQFDFTMRKDFALGHVKGLGEGARISLRGDLYNLFNTLNLSPVSGPIHVGDLAFNSATNTTTVNSVDPGFGRSGGSLGARVVEFQFRFQF